MIRIDAVYALICREEDVLMVNNIGGGWSLPGGAVEKGETLEEAVIRETQEETGLTIEVSDIVAVNEAFFKEKNHHVLFLTFKAAIVDGECFIKDRNEISEIRWFDIQEANELMSYYRGGIKRLLKSSSPYTFQG